MRKLPSQRKDFLNKTLLVFWLLTLPASGFAPLFYSPQTDATRALLDEVGRNPQSADAESALPEGPDAGAAPKNSVHFWLIAGTSPTGNISGAERNRQLRERSSFAVCATGLQFWSPTELGACNRSATLKAAEFTLLGLKPSGVS